MTHENSDLPPDPPKPQFKAGDVVVLRSGGPPMTIQYVLTAYYSTEKLLRCVWIHAGQAHIQDFGWDTVRYE